VPVSADGRTQLIPVLTAQPKDRLLIKKLSSRATTPTRGSPLSAGYDIYSAEDKSVPKRGKAVVDTQLSIAVPEGTYGRVAPRSGLGMYLVFGRVMRS
jgi:dUTPase